MATKCGAACLSLQWMAKLQLWLHYQCQIKSVALAKEGFRPRKTTHWGGGKKKNGIAMFPVSRESACACCWSPTNAFTTFRETRKQKPTGAGGAKTQSPALSSKVYGMLWEKRGRMAKSFAEDDMQANDLVP